MRSHWSSMRSSLSPRGWGVSLKHEAPPPLHVMRSHWSSMRSSLSPRGWGYPSNTKLHPPPHVMRSYWWTVTSCLCLIGAESQASEHKRPREVLWRYPFMDPESAKARRQEVKKEARCKKKNVWRRREQEKKVEKEGEVKSQEKKKKVLEEAPPQLLGLAAARAAEPDPKESSGRAYSRPLRPGI